MPDELTYRALTLIDREPVQCPSIVLSNARSAFVSIVITAIEFEDEGGSVVAAVEVSNDGFNWSSFGSVSVDNTQMTGGELVPGVIPTKLCRLVVSVSGLLAIADVAVRFSVWEPAE